MTTTVGELPAAGTLATTDNAPVEQAGVLKRTTLQTVSDWIVKTALSFTQSGTGAIAETVQSMGRRWIFDAQYDTFAHAVSAAAGKSLVVTNTTENKQSSFGTVAQIYGSSWHYVLNPNWTASHVYPFATSHVDGIFHIDGWTFNTNNGSNTHAHAFSANAIVVNAAAGDIVDVFWSGNNINNSTQEFGLFIGDATSTSSGAITGVHVSVGNTVGTDCALIGFRSTVSNNAVGAAVKYGVLVENNGAQVGTVAVALGGAGGWTTGIGMSNTTLVDCLSFAFGTTGDGIFYGSNAAGNAVLEFLRWNKANQNLTVKGAFSSAVAGDVILLNATHLRSATAANNASYRLIGGKSDNTVQIDPDGQGVSFGGTFTSVVTTNGASSSSAAAGDIVTYNALGLRSATAANNATYPLIQGNASNMVSLDSGGQGVVFGGAMTNNHLSARVAGDVYVIVDASGNFHKSAIGPAS